MFADLLLHICVLLVNNNIVHQSTIRIAQLLLDCALSVQSGFHLLVHSERILTQCGLLCYTMRFRPKKYNLRKHFSSGESLSSSENGEDMTDHSATMDDLFYVVYRTLRTQSRLTKLKVFVFLYTNEVLSANLEVQLMQVYHYPMEC